MENRTVNVLAILAIIALVAEIIFIFTSKVFWEFLVIPGSITGLQILIASMLIPGIQIVAIVLLNFTKVRKILWDHFSDIVRAY